MGFVPGHVAGRVGKAAFVEDAQPKGIPGNHARWDCFGSLGPAAFRVVNPGEAESVQVGTTQDRRCCVKASDRWGISRRRNTMAKGFVRSARSLRSIYRGAAAERTP